MRKVPRKAKMTPRSISLVLLLIAVVSLACLTSRAAGSSVQYAMKAQQPLRRRSTLTDSHVDLYGASALTHTGHQLIKRQAERTAFDKLVGSGAVSSMSKAAKSAGRRVSNLFSPQVRESAASTYAKTKEGVKTHLPTVYGKASEVKTYVKTQQGIRRAAAASRYGGAGAAGPKR